MPEGKTPSKLYLNWIALGLTAQWGLGIAFALVAQGALVFLLIKGLPFVGGDLLGLARWAADLDLPAHIAGWR
jgi:hypothetical protein